MKRPKPGSLANQFMLKQKPQKEHRCRAVKFAEPIEESIVACTCGETMLISVWGLHAPRTGVSSVRGEGNFLGYRAELAE